MDRAGDLHYLPLYYRRRGAAEYLGPLSAGTCVEARRDVEFTETNRGLLLHLQLRRLAIRARRRAHVRLVHLVYRGGHVGSRAAVADAQMARRLWPSACGRDGRERYSRVPAVEYVGDGVSGSVRYVLVQGAGGGQYCDFDRAP